MDFKFFSKLTREEQLRLFPSYIGVLHQLLASSYQKIEKLEEKEKKLYSAISELEGSGGLMCDKCFEVSNDIVACEKCYQEFCPSCSLSQYLDNIYVCEWCSDGVCTDCNPVIVWKGDKFCSEKCKEESQL